MNSPTNAYEHVIAIMLKFASKSPTGLDELRAAVDVIEEMIEGELIQTRTLH